MWKWKSQLRSQSGSTHIQKYTVRHTCCDNSIQIKFWMQVVASPVIFSVKWRTHLGVYCLWHPTIHFIFQENEPLTLCWGRWAHFQLEGETWPSCPTVSSAPWLVSARTQERNWFLDKHIQTMPEASVCLPKTCWWDKPGWSFMTNNPNNPLTTGLFHMKRLLESSLTASSISVMLPFFPAMPLICSASYLVITVCEESTIC